MSCVRGYGSWRISGSVSVVLGSISYCGEEEHHLVVMSNIDWVAPNINCDDAVLRVAASDQFCNWNETFCNFTIAMSGTLYFALPDTIAHQGRG